MKKPNLKRLDAVMALVEHIHATDPVRFNMLEGAQLVDPENGERLYNLYDEHGDTYPCKTACCFAGWAEALAVKRRAKVTYTPQVDKDGNMKPTRYSTTSSWGLTRRNAMDYLGIDNMEEAELLFRSRVRESESNPEANVFKGMPTTIEVLRKRVAAFKKKHF